MNPPTVCRDGLDLEFTKVCCAGGQQLVPSGNGKMAGKYTTRFHNCSSPVRKNDWGNVHEGLNNIITDIFRNQPFFPVAPYGTGLEQIEVG
ncbi:MAG: hypothetical protein ABFR63_10415 [Thermodesulfobacteriota bacterium]